MSIIDNFLYLIEHIVIGGAWKPVQTGIKISVLNSICLIDKLFKDDYYYFFTLNFRLNQDALENLFSTLRRHGNVNPTPLQVKRCLRLITLCQFVDTHKTKRNYDCDNDEHYIDFFNTLKKTVNKEKKDESIIPPEECMYSQIYENEQDYSFVKPIENTIQCNVINNIIGSAISYVLRKQYVCRSCVITLTANDNNGFSIYTNNLSFGFLENPSTPLFKYITTVEAHLQEHFHRCELHPQLFKHLLFMIKTWVPSTILLCKSCNTFNNIICRYIHIRQIIHLNNKKQLIKQSKHKSFGSKSAFGQVIS